MKTENAQSSDKPPTPDCSCEGCALQEARSGRVCAIARDVYGLEDLVAQHRADVLHDAIVLDAEAVPSLSELVRLEGRRYPVGLAAASRLGLVAAADLFSHESQKEASDAPNANRALR
jgi:hypothetical protein